jgi:hypothetical protein
MVATKPPCRIPGYPFNPSPNSRMVMSSLYASSPSSSAAGFNVRHFRIVRSVLSVSAKKMSSPEGLRMRDIVGVGVQRSSLIRAAAHGMEENRATALSSMMVFCGKALELPGESAITRSSRGFCLCRGWRRGARFPCTSVHVHQNRTTTWCRLWRSEDTIDVQFFTADWDRPGEFLGCCRVQP